MCYSTEELMMPVGVSAVEADPVAVRSVGEFVDTVTRLNAAGSLPWYRGHRLSEWGVLPSIWRGYTPTEERNLTNRFRSRAAIRYSPTPAYYAHASWLSLMQHYGLPIRLLDWTRLPMVAMYFALEDYLPGGAGAVEGDAAVWILHPHELNELQKGFSFTPDIDGQTCAGLLRPGLHRSGFKRGRHGHSRHGVRDRPAHVRAARMLHHPFQ